MIGLLITASIGALAFKLGMDAQNMYRDGKNTGEVLASMPGDAIGTVAGAAKAGYDTVAGLVAKCSGGNGNNESANPDGKEAKESKEPGETKEA